MKLTMLNLGIGILFKLIVCPVNACAKFYFVTNHRVLNLIVDEEKSEKWNA